MRRHYPDGGMGAVPSTSIRVPPAGLVLADPAWHFKDKLPGKKRGAAKHYRTLSDAEIMRYPLPPLADDCLLLLWRVAAKQRAALEVCQAWGFDVKAEIIWIKVSRSGGPHPGMGRIVRNAHETCLVATRGRPQIDDHSIPSWFAAPRGRHSEKPARMYEIAELLSPGPYVELFARRTRRLWMSYGDELAT
jgi:N6-adenosine-specific RNA methylase IME4